MPLSFSVSYTDLGCIILTWVPPTSDGGSPVYNYTIYRSSIPGFETPLETTNLTGYADFAVDPGQTYYYYVVAINAVGEGPQSNELSSYVPADAPSAPLFMSATYSATGIHLIWYPPLNDGGVPLAAFNIYRGTARGSETLLTTVYTENFTDTGTSPGNTYFYYIAAINSAGQISVSSELYATIPAKTPSAPLSLSTQYSNQYH